MNLSDILTIVGMIGGLLTVIAGGALWVMQLVNRMSVRSRDIERDIDDIKTRVVKLELHEDKLEERIEKGFLRCVHLQEFKTALKDIMLHIEANRTKGDASAFEELTQSNKVLLDTNKEIISYLKNIK